MYTVILLIREYVKNKYEGKFLSKRLKKNYFNKVVQPMIDRYCNNLFIFKYDDLMELYRLIQTCGSTSILYLLDDEYDYITIVLEEKNILKVRIDLSLSSRNIKISIYENALEYSLNYEFKDRIRFRTYHEDTKDKDQQLISVSNDLLVSVYGKLLRRLFWEEEISISDLMNITENINNAYDYNKLDEVK